MPNLDTYDHSLYVDSEDAARVREREHDVPMTAAEEEKKRRKLAWEAQQARQLYEEMVLRKPAPTLLQIGAPLSQGNGNGNGNGNGHAKPVTEAEKVPV